MGDEIMIKTNNRRSNSPRSSQYLGIDVPLLLVTITLMIFGMLMMYSASWDFSWWIYDSPTKIFTRQLAWLGIGIVAAITAARMDYHHWRRLAVPAMVATIGGLLAVLVINESRHGATRTVFEGSFMPSEAAKLVTVIYLSVWLYSKRNQLSKVKFGLLPLALMIGLIGGLIMAQPDLSAAATIVFLGGMLFFLAGGDLRQIAMLLIVAVLFGWVVVQIHPTGSKRIADYLEGIRDPTQASYHVLRSFEAFIKGGFFGVGIGLADTKYTGLPVPPTDSIFAVIGEETGLVGTLGLLVLFGLFVWRGLIIARRAPDTFGALLAAGLSLWIVVEAFINMAVMIGLLPFAGNALPFMSAGGSNLVVTMTAVGILMNIARLSRDEESAELIYKNGRNEDAAYDLRRSKRGRRISRSRRTAGAR
ncbi:MAG: cell division protein FtsW [Chloroflexi bacterium]|nr:cell division protein FtsW [Chloroflexota bacterium]